MTLGAAALVFVALLGLVPTLRTEVLRLLQPQLPWVEAGQDSELGLFFSTKIVRMDQLPAPQARVAAWLASKYRIHPDAMATLVDYAKQLELKYRVPAHLILAVAAIESNFHPYLQSQAGAQGLMQVMPKIHRERFAYYGGKERSFDAFINMRVGTEVLVDCIKFKGGSQEAGLKFYFGGDAASDESSEGYYNKVQAERERLSRVALGQSVPIAAAVSHLTSAGGVAARESDETGQGGGISDNNIDLTAQPPLESAP